MTLEENSSPLRLKMKSNFAKEKRLKIFLISSPEGLDDWKSGMNPICNLVPDDSDDIARVGRV